MFGSVETFLFNLDVVQQVMDVLGGNGHPEMKGMLEFAMGKEQFESFATSSEKFFNFDLSTAGLSSVFGIEHTPVNENATPIHPAK